MVFHPDELTLVRDRRKIQARRPAVVITPDPLKVHPCRYKTGRVYKAQPGRGKPGVLDITVYDVRLQHLGQITAQDARREGFRFVSEFMRRFEEQHGHVDDDLPVWVITFQVGDHHADFDRPRLLASGPGHVDYEIDERGRQRWPADDDTDDDYTDQLGRGLPNEPEALTDRQLAPYVLAGQLRDRAREAKRVQDRSLLERVRDLELRARDGDDEAKRALHVVKQRLERVERRLARDVAA